MHDTQEIQERFDGILDAYYKAWFRYHPEQAVEVGHDTYADQLTPYGDDDIGALITLNRELLFSLDELDAEVLDADRLIDFELAWSSAALETEQLLEADWRYLDPERYLPVDAIYQLLIRPVNNFEQALAARLASIPQYLRGARQKLGTQSEKIPSLWIQSSLLTAREGASFIRSIPQHPRLSECKQAIPGLTSLISNAAVALENFANCIENDLLPQAAGDFACGEQLFGHILGFQHFLDVNQDKIHAFGEELYAETASRLREACTVLNGNDDVVSMTAKLVENHPPADQLLYHYRQSMQQARTFLQKNDIVSLPQSENLSVVDTPVFLRHEIPFVAYHEPLPNDPLQQAWYYVTPCSDPEQLQQHDYASISQTCVHEAWPGHHLQFVTANMNPAACSLPRLLNPSATLYEGWALYCEQMMLEQGFSQTPEQEFIMLKDRLWRAMRIMLDVELHCRGLSLEDAAKRMVEGLGMHHEQAMADLTWYTRSPGVPMGYATGWAIINCLRERQMAQQGDDFSLKSFHDALLSGGSMALALVIRRVFGDEAWADIESDVFSIKKVD
jgi:uncharacterized protein (DUF885 family)